MIDIESIRGRFRRLEPFLDEQGRRLFAANEALSLGRGGVTSVSVTCDIDANRYQKGIKVSDAEMNALNIERNAFHGDWNYAIRPRTKTPI